MFKELNKRFLGRDESENITALQQQYENAIAHLIELRKKINSNSHVSRCFLSAEDINGLIERWPSLEFTKTGDGSIMMSTMRTPISFHTERWDDDPMYVYTTFPLHSFTAKLTNRTPDVRSANDTHGHPHCRISGRDSRRFESMCMGSNEFLRIYGNSEITRDQLIFMFDSAMLWFTTVNLSDMYGTCLTYERPSLEDRVDGWTTESEELFELAQNKDRTRLHERLIEIGACSPSITFPGDIPEDQFINDFIFSYALWLNRHTDAFFGSVDKNCLRYAICQDINNYLRTARYVQYRPLSRIHSRILEGPKKLKRYAERYYRSDRDYMPDAIQAIHD